MTSRELLTLLSLIDYTTLEGSDTITGIEKWTAGLLDVLGQINKKYPGQQNRVAAVCVYPVFIDITAKCMVGSGICVASVVGGFPHGQIPLHLKLDEISYALDQGADEIDFVISRANVLEGNITALFEEIASAKERCGDKILKVILETGELKEERFIKAASQTALKAGADFIKTSTGKISPGATPVAVEVMLECIRQHFGHTGKKVGIKVSGGIADADAAQQYLVQVKRTFGNEWIQPSLLRIGTSRLLKDITRRLEAVM